MLMYEKKLAKLKALDPKQRAIAAATVLVIVILVMLVLGQLMKPQRSVTAYCKVYTQEKARLSKLPGDAYPSGVFNLSVSNAGEIATSFGRLERVAPDDVRPDVKTLQGLYQKINDDPTQAIAASLNGASVDDSVKAWTHNHCED